jgi:hypothetical protein
MLAVTSGALTITAHALADGGLPDLPLTFLLTALLGWTATALAGKARGPVATIAVLGGGQLVMHLVLTTLMVEDHGGPAPMTGGFTMMAAHSVATLVIALLLAKADSLLLAALSCLRALMPLLTLTLPVPSAASAPVLALPAGPGHLVGVDLRQIRGRRGPPVRS